MKGGTIIGAILRAGCSTARRGVRFAHVPARRLDYKLMGSAHHRVPGYVTAAPSTGGLVVVQEWVSNTAVILQPAVVTFTL